ncbi:hypothetical protein B0H10DRAFT_1835314 [Mycena sp. CBHHK59/15]|nr:hypothetical protein B0H10DRAFT_1835314 [Mycena sp. CBHHK59/15]
MLARISSILWSKPHQDAPSDVYTIPCSAMDIQVRDNITTNGVIIDRRLDVQKLEETIFNLVANKFPRAGSRLALRNGIYEFQIPRRFSPEVPPVVFTTENYSENYHSPSAARPPIPALPPSLSTPSVHPCSALEVYFKSKNFPTSLEGNIGTNRPLLYIHVTTFDDLTFIGTSSCHLLSDAMGTYTLLEAWTRLINGEKIENITGMAWDSVPFDAFAGRPSNIHRGWFDFGLFQMFYFVLRMIWKLFRDPKEQMMLVCVPKKFLEGIKTNVMGQLAEGGSNEWIGSSDVLLAHIYEVSHRGATDTTPMFIHVSVNLRPLPIWEDGFALSTPYIHNAVSSIALPPLPVNELTGNIKDVALHIRRGITAYRADVAGIRDDVAFHCANPMKMLVPCSPPGDYAIITNWRDAKFGKLDFSGASVTGSKAKVLFTIGYASSGTSTPLRNVCVVLGEDEDVVWLGYIAGCKEWEKIRQSGSVVFV